MLSFPVHIHAWAQIDHYSMSKGFVENNFDLFHPQTYTSEKQFQSINHPERQTRITSADFPIFEYTAALGMYALNTEEPVIFRSMMLLLSCIGLLYLFRICYFFSSDILLSLLLPCILLFSPVYLDYQPGFLPNIGGLSFVFIGIFKVLQYDENKQIKPLLLGVFWLSIGTAVRTPFAIILLGLIGYYLVQSIFARKINKALFYSLLGLVFPLIYFCYNTYLRLEYGSIFLGQPKPAENFSAFIEIMKVSGKNWLTEYYLITQWLLILFGLSLGYAFFLLKDKVSPQFKMIFSWFSISAVGTLIYIYLMATQFIHHDYYALDTFIPILNILSIVSWSFAWKSLPFRWLKSGLLVITTLVIIKADLKSLEYRRSKDRSIIYWSMFESYSKMDQTLSEAQIDLQTPILIIDPYAPNMPFILSNYHGANLKFIDSLSISKVPGRSENIIVIRQDLFNEYFTKSRPEIFSFTSLIHASNGLYVLENKSHNSHDIFGWAGLKADSSSFRFSQVDEGMSQEEFANTFEDTLYQSDHIKLLALQQTIGKSMPSEAFWHIHLFTKSNDLYNEYIPISALEETVSRTILIPETSDTLWLKSYLYNPNSNTIYFKNFEVKYF